MWVIERWKIVDHLKPGTLGYVQQQKINLGIVRRIHEDFKSTNIFSIWYYEMLNDIVNKRFWGFRYGTQSRYQVRWQGGREVMKYRMIIVNM